MHCKHVCIWRSEHAFLCFKYTFFTHSKRKKKERKKKRSFSFYLCVSLSRNRDADISVEMSECCLYSYPVVFW